MKEQSFEGFPKITEPDFLDKIIIEARIDHTERLAQAGNKVDEPAIEYADLLLRYYHRALLKKLAESGIKNQCSQTLKQSVNMRNLD